MLNLPFLNKLLLVIMNYLFNIPFNFDYLKCLFKILMSVFINPL